MHLALVALGIGPGDEVITTSITWPATANVIVHTGATPVFADVQDDTLNIDPASVARAGDRADEGDHARRTSYGQPADLDPIWALGLPVIEDAAHAAESEYRGRKIGGLSDATCFSLYATKSIAAGEGGIVTTNSDELAEAIQALTIMRRGHGSLYDIAVPGLQGEPLRRARCDRALPARQGRATAAICGCARSSSTTRPSPSWTGSSRVGARPARHARAPPLGRCGSSPAAGADRDDVPAARSPTRTSARASTSCRCTS